MPSEGPRQTQAIVEDAGELKLRTRRLRLEVVEGPSAGLALDLDGPEIRVGRGRECEVVLSDGSVSRHHLTVALEPRGVRVTDAGSHNGTRIDGLRIVEAFARDDSTITLGRSALRLRLLEATVDVPLYAGERFCGLIGRSVAIRRLFAVLERVARTDATVLVEGETGTGKELIAEAVHEASPRAEGPFVVFDCSAVSPQLVESELFGHVRGAFTGAVQSRVGAFEAADGGTLFLDEIGELPGELQPKLLRALERREVRQVGATKPRVLDVRVVAATHRNLAAEVERQTFREDLYYRLAVLRVRAPPLRERPEDIPLLAEHFARGFAARNGVSPELPPRALRQLADRAWPGNLRELRNEVERLLAIGVHEGEPPVATPAAPAPSPGVDLSVPLIEARDAMLERFEAAYVAQALAAAGGNVTRAAELAGVHRRFIHRAIKRYGLR